MKRLYAPVFLVALLLLTGVGVAQLAAPGTPLLPATGLLLSTLAPLSFLLRQRLGTRPPRHHPVLISALMGLGCVMIMVGIQRFGEQHTWLLQLGLISLVGWMVYQRWVWRAGEPPQARR